MHSVKCVTCGRKYAIGTCLIGGLPVYKTDTFGRFLVDHLACGDHLEEQPIQQGERILTNSDARDLVGRQFRQKLDQLMNGNEARFLGLNDPSSD